VRFEKFQRARTVIRLGDDLQFRPGPRKPHAHLLAHEPFVVND
jgi:hypothetical protein